MTRSFLILDQLPPTHRVWVDAALTAVKANPEPNSISGSPDGVTVYRVYTNESEAEQVQYHPGYVTFSPCRPILMTATRPGEVPVTIGLDGTHFTSYKKPPTWFRGRPVVYAEGVA